ncbi:hypothetical protein BVRB_5g107730 [Beta vulgaris subsp. vulgaris]|nr:hypothetical protein BVRB_5g107730 [Beta vulgaris subsp. vulgaris]
MLIAVKLAVVSNFDTRLRKLLKELNVLDLYGPLSSLQLSVNCNLHLLARLSLFSGQLLY